VTLNILLELVEDAFLTALEEGAEPPQSFTVRLPLEAFGPDLEGTGEELSVAGYVVTLDSDGTLTKINEWVH
jgi:hypothetical protein